jgi:hypothetical protein
LVVVTRVAEPLSCHPPAVGEGMVEPPALDAPVRAETPRAMPTADTASATRCQVRCTGRLRLPLRDRTEVGVSERSIEPEYFLRMTRRTRVQIPYFGQNRSVVHNRYLT